MIKKKMITNKWISALCVIFILFCVIFMYSTSHAQFPLFYSSTNFGSTNPFAAPAATSLQNSGSFLQNNPFSSSANFTASTPAVNTVTTSSPAGFTSTFQTPKTTTSSSTGFSSTFNTPMTGMTGTSSSTGFSSTFRAPVTATSSSTGFSSTFSTSTARPSSLTSSFSSTSFSPSVNTSFSSSVSSPTSTFTTGSSFAPSSTNTNFVSSYATSVPVTNTQSSTLRGAAFSTSSAPSSFSFSQPATTSIPTSPFASGLQSTASSSTVGGNFLPSRFGGTSNSVPFSTTTTTGGQNISQSTSGNYPNSGTEDYSQDDPSPLKAGIYVGHWSAWVIDTDAGTREEIGGGIQIELYEIELLYDEETGTPYAMQGQGEMTVSGWDFFENIVFDVRATAYLNTGNNQYIISILAEFGEEDQFWSIRSSEVNLKDNIINGSFNLINKYDIYPQGGFVENLTYIN